MIIDNFAENPAEYQREKDYLWRQAVLITDSILLIKQHSVNCVAAGLFTLTSNDFPFEEKDAYQIIDTLFTGTGNTLPVGEEIRSYIHKLYQHFLEEHRSKTNAKVLVDFLRAYPQKKQDTPRDPVFKVFHKRPPQVDTLRSQSRCENSILSSVACFKLFR
ncbi:MAG: hypothetical protein U5P10_03015 [Spirochaetia bacterium]|nr:hypothetical protein [Spirochaetia bacterium]